MRHDEDVNDEDVNTVSPLCNNDSHLRAGQRIPTRGIYLPLAVGSVCITSELLIHPLEETLLPLDLALWSIMATSCTCSSEMLLFRSIYAHYNPYVSIKGYL